MDALPSEVIEVIEDELQPAIERAMAVLDYEPTPENYNTVLVGHESN